LLVAVSASVLPLSDETADAVATLGESLVTRVLDDDAEGLIVIIRIHLA